jgi:von Willebrand factor type A domain/Carboxypeptidase regulatory-like domain
MKRTLASRRLARRSAVLAGAIALCAAGTAHADITGKVTNAGGVPIPGLSVTARDAGGGFADSVSSDANGDFRITTAGLGTSPSPFTLNATYFDSCKPSGASSLTFTSPAIADGAVQNVLLDAAAFCSSSFVPSTLAPATGNAWPERNQVLSPPGGVTYLRVLAPFSATGLTMTLTDGTVVGTSEDEDVVPVTAPAAGYNGSLNLTYTFNGAAVSRTIGTLVSGKVVNPNPPAGVTDLAAIVDISGSMSGSDPSFRRRDAVQLLVDLAGQGDRVMATAFDDAASEIFPRTTIAGEATKGPLKALARKRIVNDGGTNYNEGLGAAFTTLAADPINAAVPKAAIFLTDGANNGDYNNVHLRFAFNGTGRTWPICVVQLGKGFAPADTARLKRIAADTGGVFASTPSNTELENLYFQCRGKSSGATTLLKKTSTFKIGQSRLFTRKVKSGQKQATFFVSFGVGKYGLQLKQPGGRVLKRSAGKAVRLVRGKTFAFFRIQKPKVGNYTLRVTRLATGGPTDKATTTITVQKKR